MQLKTEYNHKTSDGVNPAQLEIGDVIEALDHHYIVKLTLKPKKREESGDWWIEGNRFIKAQKDFAKKIIRFRVDSERILLIKNLS